MQSTVKRGIPVFFHHTDVFSCLQMEHVLSCFQLFARALSYAYNTATSIFSPNSQQCFRFYAECHFFWNIILMSSATTSSTDETQVNASIACLHGNQVLAQRSFHRTFHALLKLFLFFLFSFFSLYRLLGSLCVEDMSFLCFVPRTWHVVPRIS